MTMNELEREILLAEAGELPAARRAALERDIAAAPEAAACRARLRRLMAAAAALPTAGPSELVIDRIMAEAWARRERRVWRFPLPTPRLAAAAAAAAMALAAGGWWLARAVRPAADTVGDLQTIVAMVSPHAYDPDSGTAAEQGRLRELARHLLIMEGFVSEEILGEEPTSREPAPTTLRWRSTAESQPERCV